MLTLALSRDSSDLHIYEDLYGENNDCFYNLRKCSDFKKNRLTLLKLSVFPSCVVLKPIYGHSVSFRKSGLLSLYILSKVGYSDEAVNPIR